MAKDKVVPFGETPLAEMTFAEMMSAGVIDIAEVDDVVLVDQSELVGKPFILFDWDIKMSQEFGGFYAICRVKTEAGTAVFTDGGTGIVESLERYDKKLQELPEDQRTLYFHYGLKASHYVKELTDEDTGESRSIPATTYYFDNRRRP